MTAAVTHEQWQQQVVELLGMTGWRHLHVRRTVGRGKKWVTATNVIGWPDLFCWHPRHGVAAIELKVGKDKPSDAQAEVLASLEQAGVRTMVAYPDDLDALALLLRGVQRQTVVA